MRFREVLHRETLTDEFGYSFSIAVPVTETQFWIDGKWEETLNGEEMAKIERAIEEKYPGWFHQCYTDRDGNRKVAKENCPACQRKLKAKNLQIVL